MTSTLSFARGLVAGQSRDREACSETPAASDKAATAVEPAQQGGAGYDHEALLHLADRCDMASRYSPGLTRKLEVTVPLVRERDVVVPYVDADFFAEHGLSLGPLNWIDSEAEAALAALVGVRTPHPGEAPELLGVATRYSDLGQPTVISNFKGQGDGPKVTTERWTRGDGRTAYVGPVLHGGAKSKDGRVGVTEAFLRIKGVGNTGLAPKQDWEDVHTTGFQDAKWALQDAVFGQFVKANGIAASSIPVIGFTDTPFSFELYGHDIPARRAFEANAGHFDRLAHLNEVRSDPRAVRELLDAVGGTLGRELGLTQPLSHAELFGALVRRQAAIVVDLYWTRAAHGSPTFDNIGLLQLLDIATLTPANRQHPHLAVLRGVSEGFAAEPEQFLRPFVSFLYDVFVESAKDDAERQSLRALDPRALAQGAIETRMADNLLLHLGLDGATRERLQRDAAPLLRALAVHVRALGEEAAEGARAPMGLRLDTEVERPARYDLFGALAVVARIWAGALDPEAKIAALVKALAPVDPLPERDRAAAEGLLAAVEPIFSRLAAGLGPKEKEALFALVGEQAQALNAPVDRMIRSSLAAWLSPFYEGLYDGSVSRVALRAEINALVRDQTRRGPHSIAAVSHAVTHGTLPRDETGRCVLSRLTEHGVRIEELSDGVHDALGISVAKAAMAHAGILEPQVELTLDGHTWQTLAPCGETPDGHLAFSLPLARPPACILARVRDAAPTGKIWDMDGVLFGTAHRPLLASKNVQAALAVLAARQGRERPGLTEAERVAAQLRA